MLVTLGVLKPCYTVENSTNSTDSIVSSRKHASNKGDVAADSFLHQKMNGSEGKLSNNSNKCSILEKQLQGGPLTKQDILDVYSDVFTRIGKFPGMPYKFQLTPNAKPTRHAPRKVPIHLQDAFHKEIRNLEQLGILEETKDVTEWVNSFVIVEKKVPTDSSKIPTDSNSSQGHSMNKKLRICLDPRDLNEALEREPYYTQSIEEIMAKFHGMTRFTIADFNKGYWMVELDPESRKYTMMALDIGRFQWTRLPMGSIVAQDIFQRKLDAIFLDVPGVTGIADDMVIYGRSNLKQFTLETDQKPLFSIYRKHMVEISPRIQRLIVRSFPYQPFDIQYRRGKEIPLEDTLSRVTPTPVEEDGIQLPIVAVNLITSNIPVSSTEIELIHEETSKDPTLTLLRHYIYMGWPIDHRMLPQELHTFWNYREDLSMENGLITKGARLLIPSTLRRKVLEQIHDGHLGTEKCMLKARDSVFWPGISNDIRETVEKCGICQASSRAAKPVGNMSDMPPHAWHTLGTDLFYWNKIDYLVIRDYFSKYLIVRRLPNSSTHAVIKELGLVFTELGRPFILRSDNGPCYSSREFHNFLSFYQVDHITSSPHYSQSNGFA